MDDQISSRESIRQELLSLAADAYQLPVETLDPFLLNFIEWLSRVREEQLRQLNVCQESVIRRLATFLVPDTPLQPSTWFTVAEAFPMETEAEVGPATEFILKDPDSDRRIYCTPAGPCQLSDAEVKAVACREKIWVPGERPGGRWSSYLPLERALSPNELWIGLKCSDELTVLKEVPLYFNWPKLGAEAIRQLLRSLALADWSIQGKPLAIIEGWPPAPGSKPGSDRWHLFEADKESFDREGARVLDILHFHCIRWAGFKNGDLVYPEQYKGFPHQVLLSTSSAETSENWRPDQLLWIRLQSPLPFPPLEEHPFDCRLNCFPVLFRRMCKPIIVSNGGINVFRLELPGSDSNLEFLHIHQVFSSRAHYYPVERAQAVQASTGVYAIQRGGVEANDPREISILLNLAWEVLSCQLAGASDAEGTEELETLRQAAVILKQRAAVAPASSVYLHLQPYQAENEVIHVEYWAREILTAASMPKVGCRLSALPNVGLNKDSIRLIARPLGREPVFEDFDVDRRRLQAVLLNRTPKPTVAGITALCRLKFGNKTADDIKVEIIVAPADDPSYHGLTPLIHVAIRQQPDENCSEEDYLRLGQALERQLQEHYCSAYPFRVSISQ